MLTGIYVFESTRLTFQTSETVVLTSLDKTTLRTTGQPQYVDVGPGIYKVQTTAGIQTVAQPNIVVFECPSVKDTSPDAPSRASKLYDSKAQLDAFFAQPDAKSAAFPTSAH